jgi:hypothetical protein
MQPSRPIAIPQPIKRTTSFQRTDNLSRTFDPLLDSATTLTFLSQRSEEEVVEGAIDFLETGDPLEAGTPKGFSGPHAGRYAARYLVMRGGEMLMYEAQHGALRLSLGAPPVDAHAVAQPPLCHAHLRLTARLSRI